MSARMLAALLFVVSVYAQAGEIIRFEAGAAARHDVVLANVPIKALVTEFLDPGDSGLGKSVGYLVWREILTAISDQAGAGVILARAPGEQRITDMLDKAYHDAAVRIAREQSASMAVWGAVNTEGDELFVSTYLSLLPEAAGMRMQLRLSSGNAPSSGLQADIGRTNFNFPVIETTRAELFERRIVTRKQASVRMGPDATTRVLATFPQAKALDAIDMDKGWFKVRLANGQSGYVDNAAVDVPPSTVEAAKLSTALQAEPGAKRGQKVTLDGAYRVLDMRYLAGKGLWYQIEDGDLRGWIPATVVRARFSLPVVHFVAGLYRYQFKRYPEAQREFSQYVNAPDSAADNPSLASAYQLLGASTLLGKSTVFEASPAVLEHFSKAVAATPYDPAAYSLRALSAIAVHKQAGAALDDLEHALALDPADTGAIRLAAAVRRELSPPGGELKHFLQDTRAPDVELRLQQIEKRYALPATSP